MLNSISPVKGWMLDCVAVLDEHLAGFAGSYLRASDERRQVIAAHIAVKPIDLSDAESAREQALYLSTADHCTILAGAFGTIPKGFRPALGRAGSQPQHPRFYTLLHEMLTSPSHEMIVPTIQQSASIDLNLLRIIRKLPVEACTPKIAASIENRSVADDFSTLIGLLLAHGADRTALVAAFQAVANKRGLVQTVNRWALKIDLPHHPVPQSTEYHPIESAADLRRMAGRYRNCAAQYLAGALNGYDAFAVFTPDIAEFGVVVHLRVQDDRWVVQGLFGRNNERPKPEIKCAALNYLARHGVLERSRDDIPSGKWAALSRFISPLLFELQDDY